MRIPWSDAEIPKGGSRARHRSGAGLEPNGDLCAISRVGADLDGRSDGGSHAKDVGLRSWPDKTADRADRALNPRGHRWSDDGYEPEIAFEIPILGEVGLGCISADDVESEIDEANYCDTESG